MRREATGESQIPDEPPRCHRRSLWGRDSNSRRSHSRQSRPVHSRTSYNKDRIYNLHSFIHSTTNTTFHTRYLAPPANPRPKTTKQKTKTKEKDELNYPPKKGTQPLTQSRSSFHPPTHSHSHPDNTKQKTMATYKQKKKPDRNDCNTTTKQPSAEYLIGTHSSLARMGLSDTLENAHTVVLGRNKLLSTTPAGS